MKQKTTIAQLRNLVESAVACQAEHLDAYAKYPSDNPQVATCRLHVESLHEAFIAVLHAIRGDRVALRCYGKGD